MSDNMVTETLTSIGKRHERFMGMIDGVGWRNLGKGKGREANWEIEGDMEQGEADGLEERRYGIAYYIYLWFTLLYSFVLSSARCSSAFPFS